MKAVGIFLLVCVFGIIILFVSLIFLTSDTHITFINESDNKIESIVIMDSFENILFSTSNPEYLDSIECNIEIPGELSPQIKLNLSGIDTLFYGPYSEGGEDYLYIIKNDTMILKYGDLRIF